MRLLQISVAVAGVVGGVLVCPEIASATDASDVRELLEIYPGACIVEPEWQELCSEAMDDLRQANPIALPGSLDDAKAPTPEPAEPPEQP